MVRERGGGKRVAESPNLYEHAPIHTRGESSEMLERKTRGEQEGRERGGRRLCMKVGIGMAAGADAWLGVLPSCFTGVHHPPFIDKPFENCGKTLHLRGGRVLYRKRRRGSARTWRSSPPSARAAATPTIQVKLLAKRHQRREQGKRETKEEGPLSGSCSCDSSAHPLEAQKAVRAVMLIATRTKLSWQSHMRREWPGERQYTRVRVKQTWLQRR